MDLLPGALEGEALEQLQAIVSSLNPLATVIACQQAKVGGEYACVCVCVRGGGLLWGWYVCGCGGGGGGGETAAAGAFLWSASLQCGVLWVGRFSRCKLWE